MINLIYKLKSVLFISFILLGTIINAQNCNDYKWKQCDGFGPPYKYSGQSKSAFFIAGQSSFFHLVAYKGFEYSIRICSDKRLKDIYFRIREKSINKKILYDSSTEDIDYLEKQFSSEKTQNLIIEVIVPENEKGTYNENPQKYSGCVGVLIEYYKKPKIGF